MSLRVLIAPDKFKGTLTAHQAAVAIAKGWRRVRPQDDLEPLPMSDGGDGFGEIVSAALGARPRTTRTVDAAHRPHSASWGWDARNHRAIIESAKVIGLALLPPKKFHPFDLDTTGLGEVLLAAAGQGARQCLIGIGGSATNDGGFGMARALGWKFLDTQGGPIEQWTQLDRLKTIRRPRRARLFARSLVAVDVQNPLLGPRGCTRIYGPQKGLVPADFPHAEKCLRRLAKVMSRTLGQDHSQETGTGAAGGLGFGLRCFLGARLESGFDLFAKHAKLEARLRRADLVVTGEGAIDRSTIMGKGVGEVAQRCAARGIPCLGLGGCVNDRRQVMKLFTAAFAIAPDLADAAEAKARPAYWLAALAVCAAQIAGDRSFA